MWQKEGKFMDRPHYLLLMVAEWKAQQKSKSSIRKCYNYDIRGDFAQDCCKPKKEETLLSSNDEEAMLR
ncbi:hypothetical protein GUJ93_ZPchr0005g16065 [Zizania palustris]|uniref:Uncharacterized protein n=1 Tax=Zizania palustris TaxID=103762 RepID=A0A8J5SGN5_ZIZPA|nr:hypothetical protein GUJ93_ZPchr0005g16065 [Zizania palustris]